MVYFVILGSLFLIAGIVFFIIELLDIYLWGIAAAMLVISMMFGFWLRNPIAAISLLFIAILLAGGGHLYRQKYQDF